MLIKKQDNIRALLRDVTIPKMLTIEQLFEDNSISDAAGAAAERLRRAGVESRVKKGMRIAITGTSRGVANIAVILREVASFLQGLGAEAYIFPAMGSHGGATAEGQLAVLRDYGVTEAFCGCKIHSSMETVLIGTTVEGQPVYVDKFASECDAIVPVGRIKAHSAFRGTYESGLMKMLCIGIGKQKGAESLHDKGFGLVAKRIPEYAEVVLKRCNIPFGVGIMENACDKTCRIEVLKGEEIPEKEPALLEYAKSQMAGIPFPETDVLIVKEIGKNFSGSGMDPNVTGTWSTSYGGGGIQKQRVVVLDVTEESHGNALGVGRADTIPMRLFDKIDFTELYPNVLTSKVVSPCCIPMVMEDDRMAVQAAIKLCESQSGRDLRVVLIKNSHSLSKIMISESLLAQAKNTANIQILEEPRGLRFSPGGELLELR